MKRVVVTGLGLALFAGTALAQTTAPSTAIDISPISSALVNIIGVVLTGLVTWIGWYVKNLISSKVDLSKTQLDEQLQQMFNEAAARSIAYAETVVEGAVPKSVDVNSVFVATAAKYLMDKWPDLVKKVGLSPEAIRDTILARLPSGPATAKVDAIVLAKAAGSSPPPAAKP